jgi:hypothetical protein
MIVTKILAVYRTCPVMIVVEMGAGAAQYHGFGLDHAAVGRESRRQRSICDQERDTGLAGSGDRGSEPGGVLRRLAIGSPGWFGRSRQEVREVAYDYLANAVAQGTFPPWLEQNAKAINGMSVVVGRGRSFFEHPDRVSTVLTLPPEPRTLRVVIGWRDHRRGGGNNDN